MHHPTDRIAHTTAFVTPVVEHWLERERVTLDSYLNVQLIYMNIYIYIEVKVITFCCVWVGDVNTAAGNQV